MSTYSRLTQVLKSAAEVPFDDTSKIILISDCHRSDNSWADNFANNQNLFFKALEYYYDNGFMYIELGDSDELWENNSFSVIREAYSHVFWLLRKYYVENRMHMLWGNHDIAKSNPDWVKKNLYSFFDQRENKVKSLFDGIELHEGLVLKHTDKGYKIMVVHGHQGDFINDDLWRLGMLLCKYIWRTLKIIGVHNPFSPAENNKKRNDLEKRILKWIEDNDQMLIAGHFHRSTFAYPGQTPYFNTGSCVHPRCITGIEIDRGEISLIKWSVKTKPDGILYVGRDVIEGPVKLKAYFEENKSENS